MLKRSWFMVLAALVMSLAACSTFTARPIIQYTNQPVPQGQTRAQVAASIKTAMAIKGWHVVREDSKQIVAGITVRGHYAEVKIPYSTRQYSIVYSNSRGLNAQDGQIHYAYNHWVKLLNELIVQQLHHQKFIKAS